MKYTILSVNFGELFLIVNNTIPANIEINESMYYSGAPSSFTYFEVEASPNISDIDDLLTVFSEKLSSTATIYIGQKYDRILMDVARKEGCPPYINSNNQYGYVRLIAHSYYKWRELRDSDIVVLHLGKLKELTEPLLMIYYGYNGDDELDEVLNNRCEQAEDDYEGEDDD